MSRIRSAMAVALVAGLLSGGCGGDATTATGIVVEVEGDLTSVDFFDLVLSDGSRLRFEPAPDVTFHGTAPLTHIRDHLRSGERIEVRYEELDDGTLVALEVDDAP